MEDTYYAILTPSQAALMLFGVPPPAPRETAKLMREIFVKKEKLLEEEYVKILETNIELRKNLEHGTKEDISGKEIDDLLLSAEKYLKRISKLFKQIEKIKEDETVIHIYDTTLTVVRDVLRAEGVDKVKDADVMSMFESELVHKGAVPVKLKRILKQIFKGKKDYDAGKLTKTEGETIKKVSNEFTKHMIEHLQRQRGRELERARIRLKHGKRHGEVLLLDKIAFIIHDIDHEEKEISKATIAEDGGLIKIKESNLEELEHAIANMKIPPKVFIKEKIFENLRELFGKDVEILINY